MLCEFRFFGIVNRITCLQSIKRYSRGTKERGFDLRAGPKLNEDLEKDLQYTDGQQDQCLHHECDAPCASVRIQPP